MAGAVADLVKARELSDLQAAELLEGHEHRGSVEQAVRQEAADNRKITVPDDLGWARQHVVELERRPEQEEPP